MTNYYMLGGDGREYGPVAAEQLRQWAAEGRANVHTQVRAERAQAWAPLGAVPELSAPAGGPAPVIRVAPILAAAALPVVVPIPTAPSAATLPPVAPKLPPLPSGTRAQAPAHRLTGAGPEDAGLQVRMLADELARGAFWMNLFAVLLLGIAGLATMGTLGIGLVALFLPIWAAILVFLIAGRAKTAAIYGRWQDLQEALRLQRRFYTLMAIFCVALGIALVALAVYFFTLGYLTGPLDME